jgi:hypothetical protein
MNLMSLYSRLQLLPENLKKEVADFVDFLLEKERLKNFPGSKKNERKLGLAKGLIKMNADFEEPLDDFNDYR